MPDGMHWMERTFSIGMEEVVKLEVTIWREKLEESSDDVLETRSIRDGATNMALKGEGCREGDEVGLGNAMDEGEDDGKVVDGVFVLADIRGL